MIKIFENLNEEIYRDIKALETICLDEDQTSLKLELEYKIAGEGIESGKRNEFLYYREHQLVGYIGICEFSAGELEVMGMVHPSFRGQRIFTDLSKEVMAEWQRRDAHRILLLTDHDSESGQHTIRSAGARYDSSEYEMHLKNPAVSEIRQIRLQKATNEDATEIARQERIYFKDEGEQNEEKPLKLPEEEEKRGITIYLAYKENLLIGKVNLVIEGPLGAIYGLGVLPEYRRKGYGKQILQAGINKLIEKQCKDIMLQVATNNENALNLYLSVGFKKTSIMDYFLME